MIIHSWIIPFTSSILDSSWIVIIRSTNQELFLAFVLPLEPVESVSKNFGYDELELEVKFNYNLLIMKIITKIT
jgi:hypothetical protein